jgi:UDP-glucose 4-epimerase
MILVTGSEGLIGSALIAALEASGHKVRRFDIRRSAHEDIRNREALAAALKGVEGVVHLAAISRVVWGERDPDLCRATNVDALRDLLKLCVADKTRWFIFASSREVYGHKPGERVAEDSSFSPLNVYARTKCEGEALAAQAAQAGLVANICRFSSVYGSPNDHRDRVSMAFAIAAAKGGVIRRDGADCTFDFTSVRDVVRGAKQLVDQSRRGEQLPPVHFVTGRGTTLRALSDIAARHARAPVSIIDAPSRSFDVSHFVGDPSRAAALLGWTAEVAIETGMADLIDDVSAVEPAAIETASHLR